MQWGYEHIKESTSCRTIFEYNDNGKARLAAAQAIETWLACGMGQVIDTGGKPDYAQKPAAGTYDGKALDARPVAE